MRAGLAVAVTLSMLSCAQHQASERRSAAAATMPAGPAEGGGPGAARYSKARTRNPGCVQAQLKVPDGVAIPERVKVRFAVLASGQVERFDCLTPDVPQPVVDAVRDAVTSCVWSPGTDRQGNPVALWVTLPFHFVREGES